jgi:protein SCO1/2
MGSIVSAARRRTWLLLFPAALVLAGAGAHAGRAHAPGPDAHATHQAAVAGAGRYERSLRHYRVPDVTLIDAAGTKVPLAAVLAGDAPVLLNFIFTTCTSICPVMSATFAEVQRRLGTERGRVRMISITIDPEHDSPERLRAFASKHDAGPRWLFLTGSVPDIVAVQKAFDAYRGGKMSHQPFTLLRAAAREPWVRLEGLASAADVVAEYRRALAH